MHMHLVVVYKCVLNLQCMWAEVFARDSIRIWVISQKVWGPIDIERRTLSMKEFNVEMRKCMIIS